MTIITGGLVRYERSVKVAEYENKKFVVELTFTVEDGKDADEAISTVSDQAIDLVHSKLGIAAPAKTVRTAAPKPTDKPAEGGKEAYAEKEAAKGNKRPPKEKPAEAPKYDLDLGGSGQSISTGEERKEPAADSLDDLLGLDEPAKPITDQDIVDAITKKQAKINNAVAIKKVIGEFAGPPPAAARNIPADKRQGFLDALNAL